MTQPVPHVAPGSLWLRTRPVKTWADAGRHVGYTVATTVVFLLMPVLLPDISRLVGTATGAQLPVGPTLTEVFPPHYVFTLTAFAVTVIVVSAAARSIAGSVGRARRGRGTAWEFLPLHWADWWHLPETTITAQQARPFYEDQRGQQPRLRTVEMLIAHDAPPLSMLGRACGDHYELLRLLRAGVAPETITAAAPRFSESMLVDLFSWVPNLTPADLTRFVHAGLLRPLAAEEPDVAMRRWYRRYGRRASYFCALGLSEAEARAALEQEIPEETLAAMAALV